MPVSVRLSGEKARPAPPEKRGGAKTALNSPLKGRVGDFDSTEPFNQEELFYATARS